MGLPLQPEAFANAPPKHRTMQSALYTAKCLPTFRFTMTNPTSLSPPRIALCSKLCQTGSASMVVSGTLMKRLRLLNHCGYYKSEPPLPYPLQTILLPVLPPWQRNYGGLPQVSALQSFPDDAASPCLYVPTGTPSHRCGFPIWSPGLGYDWVRPRRPYTSFQCSARRRTGIWVCKGTTRELFERHGSAAVGAWRSYE